MKPPKIIFKKYSEEKQYSLFLLVYKNSPNSRGFFYSDENFGEDSLLMGPKNIKIITRLYNYRNTIQFGKILKHIHSQNPTTLFFVDRTFYDFLGIYIEQRTFKIEKIMKELNYYEDYYNRKTVSN